MKLREAVINFAQSVLSPKAVRDFDRGAVGVYVPSSSQLSLVLISLLFLSKALITRKGYLHNTGWYR